MKINPIKVTRTMVYSPESYLEYCEENKEKPTQDGFQAWIEEFIDEDFNNNNGSEQIEEID